MSIASWIVDGLVPSFHSFNAGIESNAAVFGTFNECVTIHSPAAANLQNYGMEDVLLVSSPDCGMESGFMPADQQFCEPLLPSTYEDTVWSDWQFRQVVPSLQTAQVVAAVEPHGFETPGCVVPSLCLSMSSSVPLDVVPKARSTDAVFFDITTEDREDDLMDVLSQLCDTVEGDMIIEQAGITAFDSILPKMSPEDIDSLLSSDTLDSESCAAVWSSASSSVSPPSSPCSDNASISSEMLTVVPPVEKKQRKKEQNKTAALRYRQKKRSEHGTVMTECEDLEKRNVELKTRVSEMMKEIDYLKGLIAEIYA